eukprot:TRINITY_DN22680_c0_g1_i1.p1 TRINITY_DN22680_c0_g1~~TRINITY_DN22680_c0_g1_i1.p1  ORF type:complete len:444 (+),score=31.15 TRINITY_DN22680_c0_g1_i1:53-1384(+)
MKAASKSSECKLGHVEKAFRASTVQVSRSVSAPRLLPSSPLRNRSVEKLGRRAVSCQSLRRYSPNEQKLAPTLHERITISRRLSVSTGACHSPVVRRSLSMNSAVIVMRSDASGRTLPTKFGCTVGCYQENGLDDLESAMAAQVSGPAVWQKWPVFIVWQCTAVFCLWLVLPYFVEKEYRASSGLESIWPGRTVFVLRRDCDDARFELWRWLSYQFSHVDWMHLLGNMSMVCVAGVPLEGLHGHIRLMVIFNLGVIGGAAFHALLVKNSPSLIGMSAGLYALVGMHVADLALNWTQSRFRYVKLTLILGVGISEIVTPFIMGPGRTSHSSHGGGFTLGLLAGLLLVRDPKVKRFEWLLQVLVLFMLSGLTLFSCYWLTQWPPRSIWEGAQNWCWVRQVNNLSLFHDERWHCVVCQTTHCVARWSEQERLQRVVVQQCPVFEYG